ncbi:MAG: hypothetical protein K2K93_06795 [Muribaculaceae bacterium]|nr:hypothetical protein [Muribaculaceae bacterium]
MNYRVSSSSPTDELLTLGRIFSEVGDYASAVLDREHLSLARRCVTRLNKVVGELLSRKTITTAENLYDMPESVPVGSDLTSLSIDELHRLYRRWPARQEQRRAEGREPLTFYLEGRIVREMMSRKASCKAEQFKIDYCVATYANELSNMSYMLSLPVKIGKGVDFPDSGRAYTSEELASLIARYRKYHDISERELLVEYVDIALEKLEKDGDASSSRVLLKEVADLGRSGIISVPGWILRKTEGAEAPASCHDSELQN